jgi:endonuclease YncB( thermonuclease family)
MGNNCYRCISRYNNRREVSRLMAINPDDVPLFSLEGLWVSCRVISVYDGDSCTVIFKLGKDMAKFKVRMEGYDSPEMRPRLNSPGRDEEKRKAIIAKDALIAKTHNRVIIMCCGKWDKYGRLLGTLYENENKNNINKWMIDSGYGYPYDGGTKKVFKSTDV